MLEHHKNRLATVALHLSLLALPAGTTLAGCGGDDFTGANPTPSQPGGAAGAGGSLVGTTGGTGGTSAGQAGGGSAGAAGTAGAGAHGIAGMGGSSGASGASGHGAGAAGASGAAAGGASGSGGIAGGGGVAGSSGGTGGGSSGGMGGGAAGGGSGGMPCSANSFHCNGDVLEVCDKGAYSPLDTCTAGLCDEAKGQCDTCHPGAADMCASATAQAVCLTDGKSTTPSPCPNETPFCTGKGACVQCTSASQCPTGASACLAAACTAGACGFTTAPAGTVVPPPGGVPTGDCTKTICDSNGGTMVVADETNLPPDDGTGCTIPACNGSSPEHPPLMAGTTCGKDGVCTGTGICGECVPGDTRCVGNGEGLCQANGEWAGAVDCTDSTPVCSGKACAGVVQTAVGDYATCALLSDGAVRCWGNNYHGVLGAPASVASSLVPLPVAGLPKIVSIAMGGIHACGIDDKGFAWCWGDDSGGQLGDNGAGMGLSNPTPVKIASFTFKQLALGYEHSCGIATDGFVLCWGSNASGQVGSGVTLGSQALTPVAVATFVDAIDIGAGFNFSCGASTTQGVKCWGANDHGQLGSGTAQMMTNQLQTVKLVTELSVTVDTTKVTHIGVGRTHACAVAPGIVFGCWGSGKHYEVGYGQGDSDFSTGYEAYFLEPNEVSTGFPDLDPALGSDYTCLPFADGMRCSGQDDQGQLGDGMTAPFLKTGSLVVGISGGPSSVSAGLVNACAVQNGEAYCWGSGMLGQIGDGMTMTRTSATAVQW